MSDQSPLGVRGPEWTVPAEWRQDVQKIRLALGLRIALRVAELVQAADEQPEGPSMSDRSHRPEVIPDWVFWLVMALFLAAVGVFVWAAWTAVT